MNELQLTNISFAFKAQGPLLFSNVNMHFPGHAIHFIKGKNGSGKSTLFRLIRGLIHATEQVEGSLTVNDKVIELTSGMKPISTIKMVPQQFDHMLASQFSFIQNLQFANMPSHPGLQPLPTHQPLPALLERFGIDMHQPIHLLSGGQRQILAIIMALQQPTSILLLDEPTAALDEKNAQLTMAFLQDLLHTRPITILIISHDRELVDTYATKGYYELIVDPSTGQRVLVYHTKQP